MKRRILQLTALSLMACAALKSSQASVYDPHHEARVYTSIQKSLDKIKALEEQARKNTQPEREAIEAISSIKIPGSFSVAEKVYKLRNELRNKLELRLKSKLKLSLEPIEDVLQSMVRELDQLG